MTQSQRAIRVWYQSFTDPKVDAPYFERLREYARSVSGPEVELDVYGIQPGDRYLHPITEFRCAAQVIANALTAQREGYDAFVIGHFQEPALAEARAAVEMPVIGLGEATMLHACTLGRKIGLVTINPIFIPYHEDQIARHGLARRVVAIRAVEGQVDQFNRAFEDEREYRRLRDDYVRQIEPMLALGIDVVIPAGGYPMLLFAREPGFAIGGATVLNGLPVAIAAAETAVRLARLNGTCTSRCATFALPAAEAVDEFERTFEMPAPAS
ncbi:MAG TPA: aspartate/glutamate racemase family protein [Solirubrobacteraceae bacterium]|jgi:Asp/Glu/hydantoin racemase